MPGVTAALAAAAELGTSLTQRGSVRSVTFATPRVGAGESMGDWAASVAAADAGAIYMGAGQAGAISAALIAAGQAPSTPVAIVENASLPESRTSFSTLGALHRLADQADERTCSNLHRSAISRPCTRNDARASVRRHRRR